MFWPDGLAIEKWLVLRCAASQRQTGASGEGLVQSGLDMSLAPPPPALIPNAASTASLHSIKRKAVQSFPMAWPPGTKRSCKENEKDGLGENIRRCPEAHVNFHGSSPAIGGSTEQDRKNWGRTQRAYSSMLTHQVCLLVKRPTTLPWYCQYDMWAMNIALQALVMLEHIQVHKSAWCLMMFCTGWTCPDYNG